MNFAVFSAHAERIELCFFDERGRPQRSHMLPENTEGVWHGFLPGCAEGQCYGYRAHGPYDPGRGLRFNPNKLLIDPYARRLAGQLRWTDEIFGYLHGDAGEDREADQRDSAAFVPKGIVTARRSPLAVKRRVPWRDTVIYETHPRGFTMQHPALSPAERGKLVGLRHSEVLAYLKALGVTTVELMPVQAFLDERFLAERGLSNYWGYNPLCYFAVESRYLSGEDPGEFREMVEAIHHAGLEVVLDVVYNHTAEGDHLGPTLSFRGLDNASYYRLATDNPRRYINDSGCGNTLNVNHPRVLQLVMDSLRYWAGEMGVDGFRFDLATCLGRGGDIDKRQRFDPCAPLFAALRQDPVLARAKLIAEPWDVGTGGYQLGNFPRGWAEWNDQFRDVVRRFWRGDDGMLADLARRVHGSSDIFERQRRRPWSSVNFVSSHDGFTLRDLVTYEHKHNEANGEGNRDGHEPNFSRNYGVEGESGDSHLNELRHRQRLNLLATVLLSQGTPMFVAGDEFGHSQAGNNNAYAQDNPTTWLDWAGAATEQAFTAAVRQLLELRRRYPLLRQPAFLHGENPGAGPLRDIEWRTADGRAPDEKHWKRERHVLLLLSEPETAPGVQPAVVAVAVGFNGSENAVRLKLPSLGGAVHWDCEFVSQHPGAARLRVPQRLPARSVSLFVARRTDS